jgi:hypothetical protein
MDEGEDSAHVLSRRTALRGAAVAATAAWVVPVVQVVSMQESAAASAAPPSVRGAGRAHAKDPGAPAPRTEPPPSPRTELPPAVQAVGFGTTTVAAGTAAVLAAGALRSRGAPGLVATRGRYAGRHRSD